MDIGVIWDPLSYRGDWSITTSDLLLDPGGLQSAVMLSLFTDRRAPSGYLPPAGSAPDRRGWWGDTYTGLEVGSWLWTLDRSLKSGDLTLLNATQDICTVALQWLIDEGVVATISVQTTWQQVNVIGIKIVLTKPDGLIVPFNFDWAWLGVGTTYTAAASSNAPPVGFLPLLNGDTPAGVIVDQFGDTVYVEQN